MLIYYGLKLHSNKELGSGFFSVKSADRAKTKGITIQVKGEVAAVSTRK